MDHLNQYLPEDLPPIPANWTTQANEGRELRETVQSQLNEMRDLGTQIFDKVVYKRKLETSISALSSLLENLGKTLSSKIRQQNNLAQMVNAEREKQKALNSRADDAAKRVQSYKEKIKQNRRRVEGFNEYAIKFHNNIQGVRKDIGAYEADIRKYREEEGKLVKLNVELANAESELKESSQVWKLLEMQIAKLEVRNEKHKRDISYMTKKKTEVEKNLLQHLDEKMLLQKELDGFSIENKLNDRLEELDVVMEKHMIDMSEIQTQHDEAMRNLQLEMKEAVEKNEAFQKVLDELDSALVQQIEALDRAKNELETLASGKKVDDSDLRDFQLTLEDKLCEVNQLEEELMHTQNLLGQDDHGDGESVASEGSVYRDLNDTTAMTEDLPVVPLQRTSTPQSEVLEVEEREERGGGGGVATDRRLCTSFDSFVTMPSTIKDRRVSKASSGSLSQPATVPSSSSSSTSSSRRRRRTIVDREVSSTQG